MPLDEIQNRLTKATEADLLRMTQVEVPGHTAFEEVRDSGTGENPGHPYRTSGRQESSVISTHEPLAKTVASTARVYFLASGVELLVRDDLPAASRTLVHEILNRFSTTNDDKETDR